jgi:Gpi18-like mannosyltransferase
MNDSKLIYYFFSWRLLLFFFLAIAVFLVPLQNDFLGGGLELYKNNLFLWSWLNFDGEHYLVIVRDGYRPLTYFFFPLFPLIVRMASILVGIKAPEYIAALGLVMTNIAFFTGLVGLKKIVELDYSKTIFSFMTVLILLFPTSFYFGSFYTESIFFALVVWSFYFIRRKQWLGAGILGGLLTATRVTGLALVPAYFAEVYLLNKDNKLKNKASAIIGLLLIPLGIVFYMYYLNIRTGDPLEFFHSVEIFGPQRQAAFILLPQVFYRYFFKILPGINYSYFPVVFTTYLEIVTAVIFTTVSVVAFWRVRLSYAIYLAAGFIIPTLSGSFSSLPRYVLVLFPAFMVFARILEKRPKPVRFVVFTLLFTCLAVATALFTRGYWVS